MSKNYKRSELGRKWKTEMEENRQNDLNNTLLNYAYGGRDSFQYIWYLHRILNAQKHDRLSNFSVFSLVDENDESQKSNYTDALISLAKNRVIHIS